MLPSKKMDEIMKNVILFFALLFSKFGQAQNWHTYHTSLFHPYFFWHSYGYPYKQFKINPYDNTVWFAHKTEIFRLANNGQFTDFNENNEPVLQGYYAFEDITFTPTRTVLIDRYFGLVNYDGSNWSTIPNGVDGVHLSSDGDTIWCARINENYLVNHPQGSQLGNVSYLRRIESKNGNHWATSGVDQGVLFHFQNGMPTMYNADTIPFMLENQTYHMKFSKYSDTLYKSGDLGISLAVGNSFVDTITPHNSINMPADLIVKEFEIDKNNNIWAVFGEFGILNPPKKIGFLNRNLKTWTIYDDQNTPIVFTDGVGIELDTLGNLWVVNKQLLHVFTTGIEPAWLGTSELANDNSSIVIYPNPASQQVTVTWTTKDASCIEIFTLHGKLVARIPIHEPKAQTLDVSNLSPGMYLIRVGEQTQCLHKE